MKINRAGCLNNAGCCLINLVQCVPIKHAWKRVRQLRSTGKQEPSFPRADIDTGRAGPSRIVEARSAVIRPRFRKKDC